MPEMSNDRLRLSDYITAVCAELGRVGASNLGDGLELRPEVTTLEVDIVYSLSAAQEPEFWVRSRVQREQEDARETTIGARHRLTVRLARRASPVRERDEADPVPVSMPWPVLFGDD